VEQELFTGALGLVAPWRVARSEFVKSDEAVSTKDAAVAPVRDAGRLDLFLEFPRGARFRCPEPGCERECGVHDTDTKTWRHLDFFQYHAYPRAKVPRVVCSEHGVRQVAVSWARPGSGFTLLFEALLLTFASAMPVKRIAKFTGEHDTKIWRVLTHYVTTVRTGLDFSKVERVGVDALLDLGEVLAVGQPQPAGLAQQQRAVLGLVAAHGAASSRSRTSSPFVLAPGAWQYSEVPLAPVAAYVSP
jgi:hypothetical protein